MSTRRKNTSALLAAGIPASLHDESFAKAEIGKQFATIIGDTKMLSNGEPVSHFVKTNSDSQKREAPKVIRLIVRALVLSGQTATLTSMIELARMTRRYELDHSDEEARTLKRGDGFLAVTDFSTAKIAERERVEVELWIAEHIARGGAVIAWGWKEDFAEHCETDHLKAVLPFVNSVWM